jgi:hypothetical protein
MLSRVGGYAWQNEGFQFGWLDLLTAWLHTITLPVSLHRRTHKLFNSHNTSSHADLLSSSVLLVSIRLEDSENWAVESEPYVTTDGQSASLSWNEAPIWGLRPDFYCRRTVAGLLMWGALSDERTGLSFTFAAGPSQRSHSRVRAPWDSRPYFTLSNLRLPISSPPTTRRVTVEVFNPASTQVTELLVKVAVKVTFRLKVSQSVSKSWYRAPSGAHDQIFISVWQLRSSFRGAPSLTRGRVCLLCLPLAFASAVFLGSWSFEICDRILLSQIWDFPFRRLLRLAGSRSLCNRGYIALARTA